MKKIAIILITIMWLCGCGKSEDKYLSDLGEEREDINQDFDNLQETIIVGDGAYYINSDTDNICYIDFESKKNIPLCSRINCGHDSDDCNAHLFFASNLCAYGDYMYAIADSTDKTGQSLYRMSFDGSEKVELRHLVYSDEHDPDASTINTQFIIYKGYGYFVCNLISSDPKKELTLTVYKMRLDSDSDMKEIFSLTGCSNMMFFAGKDDEGIYIMYTYYDKETYKKCCDNYFFNVADNTTELIPELKEKGLNYVNNGKMYYHNGTKYMMIDKYDNSVKELFDCKADYVTYFDKQYIYLDTSIAVGSAQITPDERKVYVIDYEGNFIGTFEGLNELGVIAIKDGKLIASKYDEETETNEYMFYYMK